MSFELNPKKYTRIRVVIVSNASEGEALLSLLPTEDYEGFQWSTPAPACDFIRSNHVDLVIYSGKDLQENGREFVYWLECEYSDIIVLPIEDTLIGARPEATITRPIRAEQLEPTLHRALQARDLLRENRRLRVIFRDTVKGLAKSLEAKDSYTAGHSGRVQIFASMIADGFHFDGYKRDMLTEAALVHDIGKLCIDLSSLNNPGKLTSHEVELFRSHPARGKEILEPISFMAEIIPMVYHHHESFDGSGYPMGLAGKDIPFGGRVIAVADSYDAMTSHRVYRRALGHESAVEELARFSGTQFDPSVVEVFLVEIEKNLRENQLMDLLRALPE